MTKAERVSEIAAEAEITKALAAKALEAFMAAVGKELKQSGRLSLVGFGTFAVMKRAAREGKNPQNSKSIKIPARSVVKFKAG